MQTDTFAADVRRHIAGHTAALREEERQRTLDLPDPRHHAADLADIQARVRAAGFDHPTIVTRPRRQRRTHEDQLLTQAKAELRDSPPPAPVAELATASLHLADPQPPKRDRRAAALKAARNRDSHAAALKAAATRRARKGPLSATDWLSARLGPGRVPNYPEWAAALGEAYQAYVRGVAA